MATFATVHAYRFLAVNYRIYSEEGLHRCTPIGDNVASIQSPVIDYWKDVTPKPGMELSEMELPTPGESALTAYDPLTTASISYIVCKLSTSQGNITYVHGWVDSIRVKILKGEKRSIIIRWHVDWWHTIGGYQYASIVYGPGRLLRGPSSYARPDPSEPRRWVYDTSNTAYPLTTSKMHVCIKYIKHSGGTPDYTSLHMLEWEIDEVIGGTYNTPPLWMVYQGLLEEVFGLDPDSIQGAWLAPASITDSVNFVIKTGTYGTDTYGARDYPMGFDPKVHSVTTYPVRAADDNHRVYLVDQNGAMVAQLPWGYSTGKVSYAMDFGGTDAMMIFNFNDSGTPEADALEGLVTAVPLISVPITSNAYASYVYSGQREYDMEMRSIQRDQQAVNGIANIGTSAIGGAIAGSAVAPGPGTRAGALGGIVSSAVGTGVSYVTSGEFDKRTQNAVDKLKSNQAANILNCPDGQVWTTTMMPGTWKIVTLVRDTQSKADLDLEQSELGYITDTYLASASTILQSSDYSTYKTGGFRIEGLVVYNVSKEARTYISSMFARGVHID